MVRTQELCESWGGRPGLPVPNALYGLCGRKVTLNEHLINELDKPRRLWILRLSFGTDIEMQVSTESWPRRRKFSHRSCLDSNPRPFHHESGALTTELSPLPCAIGSIKTSAKQVSIGLVTPHPHPPLAPLPSKNKKSALYQLVYQKTKKRPQIININHLWIDACQ